ncbi:hypothetical protein NIES2135_26230 [Leptolyngbya boryana NIES-2135]|jgi:uncharacterized protein with HEPN domain|uniref:DUF86 domain-containing protein n=1 Tax=Leptolyngbya boryana NIES-2135 TaxID=1973484 RepID=A0A1Z4JGC0_LEPBY|nr:MULTISPECIES: HepT-like ribonuclease domain-containing protein [Leptolyngbya]BAY55799.1 hypothetical protein NIES2135_26230 [Leptolyngbya boryana NIES-2135]MBD2368896.1 DUF86 domain-containing protein [Leptolyngbya sp. FACHB-161]MBD2375236.1 DUF86 domain-containing protein [Leptolyngbya sp. FACHB-238]MBD2399654.1 DUF86 domain-containing protein [Leptolyngbya sp. FACHB-239]MBD2405860.1 DUF86 domain-containing protein [Leptolyngbya sp. FACHB-402]
MQANERDIADLWDMAQTIRRIQEFSAGSTLGDYLNSALLQSAIKRQFEVLGEAARRISPDFQQAHPEIDWRNIIGLRNVIAHRYEQVIQERLWNNIEAILPDLLVQVESLLPPLEE